MSGRTVQRNPACVAEHVSDDSLCSLRRWSREIGSLTCEVQCARACQCVKLIETALASCSGRVASDTTQISKSTKKVVPVDRHLHSSSALLLQGVQNRQPLLEVQAALLGGLAQVQPFLRVHEVPAESECLRDHRVIVGLRVARDVLLQPEKLGVRTTGIVDAFCRVALREHLSA